MEQKAGYQFTIRDLQFYYYPDTHAFICDTQNVTNVLSNFYPLIYTDLCLQHPEVQAISTKPIMQQVDLQKDTDDMASIEDTQKENYHPNMMPNEVSKMVSKEMVKVAPVETVKMASIEAPKVVPSEVPVVQKKGIMLKIKKGFRNFLEKITPKKLRKRIFVEDRL